MKPIDHESLLYNIKTILKYKFGSKFKTKNIAGETITIEPNSYIEIWRMEDAEEEEYRNRFASSIGPMDVVWDIGANIGIFSCVALKKVGSGKVISFEPHENNYESLRRNINLNAGSLTKSKATSIALSNKNGYAEMNVVEDTPGEGRHTLEDESRANDTERIATVEGDYLIETAGIPTPTILKIDVEGHETKVIKGMEEALKSSVERVFLEYHSEKNPDEHPVELLKDWGFSQRWTESRRATQFYDLYKTPEE